MPELWNNVAKTACHHWRKMLVFSRECWWGVSHLMPERPIFIVGCSRAGTTLVYKTFSESRELGTLQKETHDFWAGLHPLPDRNWSSHTLGPMDASDQDRSVAACFFYSRTGKRRFVDKNNQNGLCIPYLQALFPDAHFVYVKRNPGDNINSLMEGWRRPDEFASWSGGMPEEIRIDGGTITHWSFFLPDGWRDYVNSTLEEVCAFQYRAVNASMLEAKSMIPDRQWTEIYYEDLLEDPVNCFESAFRDCGLAFTPELERHCSSVLEKPYNAFSEIKQHKWRQGRNRESIEKVLPSTREIASRLGYSSLR